MNPAHTIHHMFEAIDANHFEALSSWVDSGIVYERPGFERVAGWDAFLNFYRNVRIIRSGRHVLDTVAVNGHTAMSCGHFSGALKDGTPIDVKFSELYRFSERNAGIVFRRTYFYQRAV